ncbi:ester cyclase [Bacteroidota bacterium]
MKTKLLSLIALVFLAGISCETKIDTEKEKEAIIAVIEEETTAFHARDFDRLAAFHVQDETNTRLSASIGGYNYFDGWDSALWEEYFKNNPEPSTNKEVKSNYKIKVYKGSAWAVFDNETFNSDGESINKSKHVEILEKVDGQWKIVYLSIINTSSYERTEENLKIATLYHELNPENIDKILADDFEGRNEKSRHTWDKENHRKYLSNDVPKQDSIFHQFAQGNWVATRFFRATKWSGKDVKFEGMHFKRFQDGKIAEIWEYGDSRQVY